MTFHYRLYEHGEGGPLIVFPTACFGREDPLAGIVAILEKNAQKSFLILEFESNSWDDDYSPWQYNIGARKFGNGGKETLKWILETAIPEVKKTHDFTQTYIVGYSLAGLFALWSFYESQSFNGVACCSGSLWFDGWKEYADNSHAPPNSSMYLSLGGKEPGSGDCPMSTIGDCYKEQKTRMEKDPNIIRSKYEMNPGGHFSDNDGRMAKAILWLLGN